MSLQDTANIATIIILISSALAFVISKTKKKLDTNRIIFFLESSKKFTFRSTQAISSSLNLPDKRVRALCSNSEKIKQNSGIKESWRLLTN